MVEANNVRFPQLNGEAIHIWWMRCPPDHLEETAWTLLNQAEQERALRFKRSCDRNRFTQVRSILKQLVATYLDKPPQQVQFDYGKKGKPILHDACDDTLDFNVSHSHELALWAFCRRHPVGVDVEYIKAKPQALDIAKRFFTPGEYQALSAQPEAAQQDFFFQLWTRKEACIKAQGESLFEQIGELEVPTVENCQAEWRSLPSQPNLYVRDLSLDPQYKAAIASFSPEATVSCFEWKT